MSRDPLFDDPEPAVEHRAPDAPEPDGDATDYDHPPHDIDVEQGIIGAVLNGAMLEHIPDAVIEHLGALPSDVFYRPAHATIWAAMQAVYEQGEHPEPLRVFAELERRGDAARALGGVYLHTCMHNAVRGIGWCADRLRHLAMLRSLRITGDRFVQLSRTRAEDVDGALEHARVALDEMAMPTADRGIRLAPLADHRAEQYRDPKPPGIPTGWPDMDRVLTVWPGQMIIVAARPGVGKSMLAVNWMLQAAAQGYPGLYVTYEMTRDETMDRFYANLGKIDLSHLTRHELTTDDWDRLATARERVDELDIIVHDPHVSTMGDLRASATAASRRPQGLSLLFVDYLQLMESDRAVESRQQEVSRISRQLKMLARQLNVVVVALSQLNRGPEQRSDKRPVLSDLRESGSIEQDANSVLLGWHSEEPEHIGKSMWDIAKQRSGPAGMTIELVSRPHYAQIGSAARW